MLSLCIVPGFDVLKDSGFGFSVCLESVAIRAFSFDSGEKAFRYRVVPAVAFPAHALCNASIGL